MAKVGTRLNRFLYEMERDYPSATGELSDILSGGRRDRRTPPVHESKAVPVRG